MTASFHNQLPTPDSPARKHAGRVGGIFWSRNEKTRARSSRCPLVNTDLAGLPSGEDVMVWLGHSSWYLQLAGKRILIDPV